MDLILKTAADLGLSMTAEFVPFSQSRNKAEKSPSLNWRVTLFRGKVEGGQAILTTDYSAGCAHCPSYKQGPRTIYGMERIAWECEHGKVARDSEPRALAGPVLRPDFADVLASLIADTDVLNYGSFEEWAGEFGFDPDSRKAERTYRACLDIALKLRNGIGEDGLAQLRAACQDY